MIRKIDKKIIMMNQQNNKGGALILGLLLAAGLVGMAYFLGEAALRYKQMDRSVTVKGLSEREFMADVVIWPIKFNVASNDLTELYESIDKQSDQIKAFLKEHGVRDDEISMSSPAIFDKSGQQYSNNEVGAFRFTANLTVTVYSNHIDRTRSVMANLSNLGKQGIVLTGDDYDSRTEYLFTRLNEVKPEMIEEATRKAREVADKFAKDSISRLGKIKTASQGQFSISDRDNNNPHIKKVRVVSTVSYYLSD